MKNKVYFLLLALIVSSITTFAQNRETRDVATFTKISFRFSGKLHLRQGTPQKVELVGKKDLLEKIETEVVGNKLSIGTSRRWNNWSWHNDDDLDVYITVKDIEALNVSGSGDLIGETKLVGGDFDLTVSGSGSLNAEIEATGSLTANVSGSGNIDLKGAWKNFESQISGSGDVTLSAVMTGEAEFSLSGSGKVKASGSAQSVRASISGSGRVLAQNLEADKCTVRISGSGDVEISVKNDLDATISGSGSVSYKGNPSHVNSHSSGSGTIRKI